MTREENEKELEAYKMALRRACYDLYNTEVDYLPDIIQMFFDIDSPEEKIENYLAEAREELEEARHGEVSAKE